MDIITILLVAYLLIFIIFNLFDNKSEKEIEESKHLDTLKRIKKLVDEQLNKK